MLDKTIAEFTEALETFSAVSRLGRVLDANPSLNNRVEQLGDRLQSKYGTAPENSPACLAAYRDHVGPDMWHSICNNPNLQQMADTWVRENGLMVLKDAISELEQIFAGTEVSSNDIKAMLRALLRQEGVPI